MAQLNPLEKRSKRSSVGAARPIVRSVRSHRGVRVCHFHGNANSYNAAISFLETENLIRFHTSLYSPAGSRRRRHPELPKRYVTTHPLWESARLLANGSPWKRLNGQQQWFVDYVCRKFDGSTARALREDDGAVYCYEDSAASTFARAEQLGVRRVYELPILHYREMRRVFEEEIQRFPALRPFFQSLHEPQWKLDLKDEELERAEVIVVPATFVRKSIERFMSLSALFIVVPYGANPSAPARTWTREDVEGPLRLLFVGRLGPRKGLHILFEALSRIRKQCFHLTLAGRWEGDFRRWLAERYPIEYDWLGPLNEDQVNACYRRAHVMVFPSLAEGFGLVISEAMASGTPVITTERTAGLDLIEHGVDGWLVDAGSVASLHQRIEDLVFNRCEIPEVAAAARAKAELVTWRNYRESLHVQLSAAISLKAPTDLSHS